MLLVAATTLPFLKYTVNGSPAKLAVSGRVRMTRPTGSSNAMSRNATCG